MPAAGEYCTVLYCTVLYLRLQRQHGFKFSNDSMASFREYFCGVYVHVRMLLLANPSHGLMSAMYLAHT